MQHNNKLFRKCEPYKVVCFDIFDTLLKRDVLTPVDVFRIVERKYSRYYPDTNIKFLHKRQEAEKVARKKSKYDEVTLKEIYEELDYSPSEKNTLKTIELETEASILHINPSVKHVFEKCLEAGKTIYIVSDMYLPQDFLEDILKREGIRGYKKLYLSCEYRKTKRSGFLFKALCDEEKLSARDIVHIGDSRYADVIGPRKAGIRSLHIKRYEHNVLYMHKPNERSNLSEKSLYAFINSRIGLLDNRSKRLGYEILGPIIFAYCQWLHHYASKSKGNKMIWFAARDMYLFKEAYRRIFGFRENDEYVYISRNSLRPAYAQAVGDIAKSGDVFARGYYSLKQIINYLGYSINDTVIDRGVDMNKKVYNIRELYRYPEVLQALESESIKKREKELSKICEKYLADKHLFSNNIILADVGWHGTTQYLLEKIQEKHRDDLSIFGMYLGCLDGTDEKIGKANYKAFVFNEEDDKWFMKGIILFESLILAPHGSTQKYIERDGDVEPVLRECETASQFILDVQQGAMSFIDDYCDSILCSTIDLNAEIVSTAFETLTREPKKEDLKNIGDLEYDNFYCSKIAAPKGIRHYLLNVGELKNDLKYSPWRIGFLYRLLKIRLPYAKLYALVRKKQGKLT